MTKSEQNKEYGKLLARWCSNTLLEIFRNDPEFQEYSKQILNMLITGEA